MEDTETTMQLTNVLLMMITGLLGLIGYFMSKLYDRFERLVDDFHKATIQIATHEERIEQLEDHR
jgi:hypothetical protein